MLNTVTLGTTCLTMSEVWTRSITIVGIGVVVVVGVGFARPEGVFPSTTIVILLPFVTTFAVIGND